MTTSMANQDVYVITLIRVASESEQLKEIWKNIQTFKKKVIYS